jgi:hypothetical protein
MKPDEIQQWETQYILFGVVLTHTQLEIFAF